MAFAVRGLKFADAPPTTASGRTVANPIARSGCAAAANDRAALRGKSRADFARKITIGLEEAGETDLWAEIAKRHGVASPARVDDLQAEAIERTKIFNATRMAARKPKS